MSLGGFGADLSDQHRDSVEPAAECWTCRFYRQGKRFPMPITARRMKYHQEAGHDVRPLKRKEEQAP